MKIGRNDKCPCGSGNKFKYCCKTVDVLNMRLKLLNFKNIKDSSKIKECMYPDNTECSSKIIKAHSIQNNKILRQISKDGRVYMPFSKDISFNLGEMNLWGRGEATTFTGFCGYHDNEIFKEIENNNFNYSDEHVFLYIYRAFALEYHKKREKINMQKQLIEQYKVVDDENPAMIYLKGLELSIVDFTEDKKLFDNCLVEKKYDVFESVIWEFNQPSKFACSGFFTLTKDIENNKIQDILDESKVMQHVFLSVFTENNKTYAIIFWLNKSSELFKNYKNQLSILNEQQKKNYINNIIPLEIENVAVNPDSWDKLTKIQRQEFGFKFLGEMIGLNDMVYENILKKSECDFFSL